MTLMIPREIVHELDRHSIGQDAARRAVAIALRNRWRRMQLSEEMREEITPKNILMIGPTGVGKTEISRRLARLAQAPFIKVEATKFTEVGYVGRDVEQIVRDLVEISISMTRERLAKEVKAKAELNAEERLIEALVGEKASAETRAKFRRLLRGGEIDERELEIEVSDSAGMQLPTMDIPGMPGASMGMLNLNDIFGGALGQRTKSRRMSVAEAIKVLTDEVSDKLLDQEAVTAEAINPAEQNGIVFLDELDKITARSERSGADVSREGVQRDLLPIVEGSTINTRHGVVRTDHILFIAAGAFHVSKPADLIPELQGRFPIRVELTPLGRDDFLRILTEPKNALARQFERFFRMDNVDLVFTSEALEAISETALEEKTGARGLRTVLEDLLLEVMFEIPGRPEITKCIVSGPTVIDGEKPVLLDKSGAEVDYHGFHPVPTSEELDAEETDQLAQESA